MICPIYKEVYDLIEANGLNSCPQPAHRGLWFDRFFNGYGQTWKVGDSSKKTWIDTVAGKTGDEAQLDTAKNSLSSLIEKLNGEVCIRKSQWHFATGLGNAHPVENGFAWHFTLGVPYIAGAAVKGLVRAWMEEWERDACDDDKLLRWFGNDKTAGGFMFFDALPVEPVQLACDIMTPHMGEWYEKGGENPMNSKVTPADWHDPVPIPFLVARDIKLMFGIAPRNDDAKSELPQVMVALKNALEWLGAGAKTATGYGRFIPDPEQEAQRERELKVRADQKRQDTERRAQEAVLASEKARFDAMSPVDQKLKTELAKPAYKDLPSVWQAWLNALNVPGLWEKAEKVELAQRIKAAMEADGLWVPEENSKKGGRCQKVLAFLNAEL